MEVNSTIYGFSCGSIGITKGTCNLRSVYGSARGHQTEGASNSKVRVLLPGNSIWQTLLP